jgi:hypothetical protein
LRNRYIGVIVLGSLILVLLFAVFLLLHLRRRKRALQAKPHTLQIGMPMPLQGADVQSV